MRVDPSRSGTDPGGTDIAGGLTSALSLLPPEDEKRIVLLSDGNETAGSAVAELPPMVEQGVRLYRRGAAAVVRGTRRDRRL